MTHYRKTRALALLLALSLLLTLACSRSPFPR